LFEKHLYIRDMAQEGTRDYIAIPKCRGFVYAYENQLYNRVKTEGRTKYLKCSTVRCDGSAKIVGDMFFLGVCTQSVLFIYLVPRGMTWTFVYKLKLVTPILIERNIARKNGYVN